MNSRPSQPRTGCSASTGFQLRELRIRGLIDYDGGGLAPLMCAEVRSRNQSQSALPGTALLVTLPLTTLARQSIHSALAMPTANPASLMLFASSSSRTQSPAGLGAMISVVLP